MGGTSAIDRGGDALPRTLGDRYRLDSKVGEGGMGVVYSATELATGKVVAVKLLKSEYSKATEHAERFLREARAVAHVSHPNVVTILDLGQDQETDALYFVMELVVGLSLAQLLVKERRLHPRRVVRIMRQVCAGLSAAHAAGIVHRDLKVSNVLLTRLGDEGEFVKVFDFGVAKFADEAEANLTHSGMMVGTLECMSPEQILGDSIDERTDIYALGATAYRALTGTPVFSASGVASLVHKHLHVTPDLLSVRMPDGSIPPALEAVVLRCLAKRPADRFASMDEVSEALAEAMEGTDSGMMRIPDFEKTPGPGSIALPEPFVPTPAPSRGSRELETAVRSSPPAPESRWSRGDDEKIPTITAGVALRPEPGAGAGARRLDSLLEISVVRGVTASTGAVLRPEDFASPPASSGSSAVAAPAASSSSRPAGAGASLPAAAAEAAWPLDDGDDPATAAAGTPLPAGRNIGVLVLLAIVAGGALAVGVFQLSRSILADPARLPGDQAPLTRPVVEPAGAAEDGPAADGPAAGATRPGEEPRGASVPPAAGKPEGAAPLPAGAAARAGPIRITASVPGAEVFVDGVSRGRIPLVFHPEGLAPLAVRITAPGREPLDTTLQPTVAGFAFDAKLKAAPRQPAEPQPPRKPRGEKPAPAKPGAPAARPDSDFVPLSF